MYERLPMIVVLVLVCSVIEYMCQRKEAKTKSTLEIMRLMKN